MISGIWNKSKKIIPNNIHILIKNVYVKIFLLIFPKGYFKKFNFSNIRFLIKVNPKNGPVDNVILFDGVLDGEHLENMKRTLKPGDTFVDAGANIGQYSLFASYCVGEKGKVISFEPVKNIFNQFNDSVEINNIKNIDLYNKGCGDENKKMVINKKDGDMGGSSIIELGFGSKKTTELVEVIVLDDILINENRVDFIKIDVEGFEYEVLLGLKKTIEKYKPRLLIEYSPHIYRQNKPEYCELILKYLLDYKYSIIDLSDMKKVESENYYKDKDIIMTYLLCR